MRIEWTAAAANDVARLAEFLARIDPAVSVQVARQLVAAPDRLIRFPRLGERLEGYGNREVRRLIVGRYEMRYEVKSSSIAVLRVWHYPEHRDRRDAHGY